MTAHSLSHFRFHLHRISWFTFLLIGLLGVQTIETYTVRGSSDVLAYATNVNRGDLHSFTNNERIGNGLVALNLDSRLNSAAQAKAEHMIANNYWAHVAPDGTTPWYFFGQVGYDYINAGENLAYGFADSSGAVAGWMNSPGHRANILGDYRDVGFGIANGATYQGSQNTVIVAMYGSTRTPAPAPSPTPPPAPAPAPTQSVAPATSTPAQPQAAPAPAPTPEVQIPPQQESQSPDTTNSPTSDGASGGSNGLEVAVPEPGTRTENSPQNISLWSMIMNWSAPWAVYGSLAVVAVASIGFAVTHIRLLRHSWNAGIHFAALHPLTDAAVIAAVLGIIFSSVGGSIL